MDAPVAWSRLFRMSFQGPKNAVIFKCRAISLASAISYQLFNTAILGVHKRPVSIQHLNRRASENLSSTKKDAMIWKIEYNITYLTLLFWVVMLIFVLFCLFLSENLTT